MASLERPTGRGTEDAENELDGKREEKRRKDILVFERRPWGRRKMRRINDLILSVSVCLLKEERKSKRKGRRKGLMLCSDRKGIVRSERRRIEE